MTTLASRKKFYIEIYNEIKKKKPITALFVYDSSKSLEEEELRDLIIIEGNISGKVLKVLSIFGNNTEVMLVNDNIKQKSSKN